jgi:hypothetical protein
VMRVDPSAAGWSVTFVCFGVVGVVQDGCDARWTRRRSVHDVYASAGTAAVAWCG